MRTAGTTTRQAEHRAFTLIELLVVVAIIALLIAILIPALASAKERAILVSCQANMHATYIAINFYANDNSSYYPLGTYDAGTTGGDADAWNHFNNDVFDTNQLWMPPVYPYVGIASPRWMAGNSYNVGDMVMGPDGVQYKCTTAYTAAASPTLFSTTNWVSMGIPTNVKSLLCAAVMRNGGHDSYGPHNPNVAPADFAFWYNIPIGRTTDVTFQQTAKIPLDSTKTVYFIFACSDFFDDGHEVTNAGVYQNWGFANTWSNFGKVHGATNPIFPSWGYPGWGATKMNIMKLDGSTGIINSLPYPVVEVQ